MVSSTTLNINIPSGKFLKIVHRLDDALWYMGNKKIPLPNENFIKIKKEEKITNLSQSQQENEISIDTEPGKEKEITLNDADDANDNKTENLKLEEEKELTEMMKDKCEINLSDQTNLISIDEDKEADSTSIDQENMGNQNSNQNLTEEKIDEPNLDDAELISKITPDIMDKNIETIFLTLVKLYFLPNKDTTSFFPLDPGKLLKDYMKPLSLELKLPLDFKLSSYKKINNFLKHLHKENLITFGKPKGIQNDFILSILWEHPMIKDFKPYVKKIKFINKKENLEQEKEKDNVILQKDEKIEILQKYKPNQKIKNFFFKFDGEFDEKSFYNLKYCNEILVSYLKEQNLMMKDAMVKLNEELEETLFRVKKNVFQPDERLVKMEEILQRWKENLVEKSFITKTNSTNESEVVTNNQFKVKIFARKLHNKNVTIVDGLQNFVNVKDVIKTFSKHFACSVTLKDFQEFKDAIFIQGYWVNELQTILQDEIKLNKKFILVEDKLKLKKK